MQMNPLPASRRASPAQPFPMLLWIVVVLLVVWTTTASEYASNAAQFDPSGRILKTEFAKRAVTEHGGPVLALRCRDGIVLSTARRIKSNKLVLSHPKKLFPVDRHICIGASGSLSQAHALANAAKSICAKYKEVYASPIPVEYLCDTLSDEMHRLTREGHGNPCGVGLVVAGWDEVLGPQVRAAT